MTDVLEVLRLWTRLADEWQERVTDARGPIEAAVIGATLPPDLYKTGSYLAHLAEQRGIDPTDLLAFLNRPDPSDRFEAARVVVQRVGLSIPQHDPPVPQTQADADSSEAPMTLEQAARRVGRSHPTLWRWCKQGVKGVRLDHRVLGGTILVTLQAMEKFSKQLAEAGSAAEPVVASPVKPRRAGRGKRGRGLADARRLLERAGIRQPSVAPEAQGAATAGG